MKRILIASLLFCVLTVPALAGGINDPAPCPPDVTCTQSAPPEPSVTETLVVNAVLAIVRLVL